MLTNLPADISPETAAWIHAEILAHNARTAAVLREEINKVDDWANGIFAALRDVLAHQLRESPELGKVLAKNWSRVAKDFDRIEVQGLPAKAHEPLEFLEARKMLYRVFVSLGAMPHPDR
ncbi:hypothetical protein [Comamonas testosteroni]|uniref:hypothetical protein n=1 Tax=Comamonas testosteroni TaxID=285 RepID=UPI0006B8E809|nr:hypothetical protein [Comamonas testosteroni]